MRGLFILQRGNKREISSLVKETKLLEICMHMHTYCMCARASVCGACMHLNLWHLNICNVCVKRICKHLGVSQVRHAECPFFVFFIIVVFFYFFCFIGEMNKGSPHSLSVKYSHSLLHQWNSTLHLWNKQCHFICHWWNSICEIHTLSSSISETIPY